MVKTVLPLQGPQVPFLVRKIRSYMPYGQRNKKKTEGIMPPSFVSHIL